MTTYLLMMMTSWAIVCDVWYLPPMQKQEVGLVQSYFHLLRLDHQISNFFNIITKSGWRCCRVCKQSEAPNSHGGRSGRSGVGWKSEKTGAFIQLPRYDMMHNFRLSNQSGENHSKSSFQGGLKSSEAKSDCWAKVWIPVRTKNFFRGSGCEIKMKHIKLQTQCYA